MSIPYGSQVFVPIVPTTSRVHNFIFTPPDGVTAVRVSLCGSGGDSLDGAESRFKQSSFSYRDIYGYS